jgi:3-deoxy-D-manno-octulosonic-acid transferase
MVRRFYRKALDTLPTLCRTKDPKVVTATRKTNVAVSGDTRFDRVAAIDKDSTRLYFAVQNDTLTIVVGVLAKDEAFIGLYKHKHPELEIHYRPHNIKRNQIEQFKKVSQKKQSYSQKSRGKPS